MGAFSAEYRCPMTDIRAATENDFVAVFDLLTARSRAAFGISSEQPAFLRQRWDAPSTDNWVAVENGAVVGYASLDENQDFVPAMWFLVERDGELIACALHWKEGQGRGWVKDIVVRESERGRGLAKALLQHAFRAYAERGADRVGLKVDSTNPTGALQLYERLGFVTDQRLEIWHKAL